MKTSLWRCSSIRCITFTFCSLMFVAHAALAQKAELVRVKDKNRKETSLYQKLITVKQPTAVKQSPSKTSQGANYVTPYNIFYHAKTNSGKQEENGFYRIADRNGKPLGWVAKADVNIWATRFALEPIRIDDANTFMVEKVDMDGEEKSFKYNPKRIPEDATAYSFILGESLGTGPGAEDNGPFPVAFCIARTGKTGVAAEANQLASMDLEIVFVLENTWFFNQDYGGRPLLSYVQDLAKKFVTTIKSQQRKDGSLPTKLGLVLYEDTHTDATFKKPVVVQPLTSDVDSWLARVDGLSPRQINGDLDVDDGLSGLAKAVMDKQVGWGTNSSKHIVLIGHAAFQEYGYRNDWNPLRHVFDFCWDRGADLTKDTWDDEYGYNSSGKTLKAIQSAAFPTGGNLGEKLRATKHIHAIRAGQTYEQKLRARPDIEDPDALIATLARIDEAMNGMGKEESLQYWSGEDETMQMVIIYAMQQNEFAALDRLALNQYQQAAQWGDVPGYFAAMDPNAAAVTRVTNELRGRIDSALQVMGEVGKGNIDELNEADYDSNEFTEPIFELVGGEILSGKEIKVPVRRGVAEVRSEASSRLVARKVIMVSREELERLGGVFDKMYQTFVKKKSRAQRRNVTDILDELKTSLAVAASGQDFDENTVLSELITDLPLRTEALKLTAGQIGVMPSKDFEVWLGELQTANQRVQTLLNANAALWINISSLGERKDRYGFLKVAELP